MTKKLNIIFSLLALGIISSGFTAVPAEAEEQTDLAVTIDQAEVSLSKLKDSDYEVPIFVRLEQNVSLNAVEFGLSVDSRCRFDIVTRSQYSEIYGEKISMSMSGVFLPGTDNCAWMTWAQQSAYTEKTSNLLMLLVKVPENAQPDDKYEIRYLSQSPISEEKQHIWFDYDALTDYSKTGSVAWSDGWIHISEEEITVLAGDVTLDNTVDILDVITLNKAILGKEVLTDAQNKAGDLDGDGKPTASDSMIILKKIVGLLD